MAIELTSQTFDATITGSALPVLVDFWAPWCGPCKMMAPVLEQLAGELDGKVMVCKVNVDDHGDLAMRYGVTGIPTLVYFVNGQPDKTFVGFRAKDDILSELNL